MIYTVLGEINKASLGVTMSHEHFKWEVDDEYACSMYYKNNYDEEKIEKDFEALSPVMTHLKEKGVQAVVETSPPIGGQNIKLLHRLSLESGIHIIPCTGWNVYKNTYDLFKDHFVESVSKKWIEDFRLGLGRVGDLVIRPSYIKILHDKGPISDEDRAMLEAAIIASKETGLGIHCHIIEGEHVQAVLDILKASSFDMTRFLWAHADLANDSEVIQKVLKEGAYVGLDNIREEAYDKCFTLLDQIIKTGYEKQVLLSEDRDFFEDQMEGKALSNGNFISHFLPLCVERGLAAETLQAIVRENPSNFYNVE